MSVIKPKVKKKKEQVRVNLDSGILAKIQDYCEWAGFSSKDDFFEEAASFVFKKDKQWLESQRHAQEKA